MNKDIFIIAEAGVNHNGRLDLALKMVDKASVAGVDAVKFQTFKAEKVSSRYAGLAPYQAAGGIRKNQLAMLKELELSFDDFIKVKEHCDKKGIIFLSTSYDYEAADFLCDLMPIFKIPSGEVTNLKFIEYIAKKNKPIILSTGMSTLKEVAQAVDLVKGSQKPVAIKEYDPLVLMHCVSSYPCPLNEVNLDAMDSLREKFKLPVGYSDHTLGIEISIAAVALGASIIEKHFTLDKSMKGPDHKASIEPEELKVMVKAIRNVEKSLGNSIKRPTESELEIMRVARRSLVAGRDLKKGDIVTEDMVAVKRPGDGMNPAEIDKILGLRLKNAKAMDEKFIPEDFE